MTEAEEQEMENEFRQLQETLNGKITARERKVLPSSGDYESQQLTCIKHGEFEAKRMFLYTEWGNWSICPACKEIARIEQEELDQRAKQAAALELLAKQQEHDRIQTQNRLKQADIPLRFQGKTLASFQANEPKAAEVKAACEDYANNFLAKKESGACLIFTGVTGTGKTHLACGIAQRVVTELKQRALFVGVAKAIRSVKATYSKDSEITEQEAINEFVKPDLLILDEVGVQFGTDAEKLILFEILNERYMVMKPTILISNLAPESLREYTGDRIFDRMRENGGKVLVFGWKSHRGASI